MKPINVFYFIFIPHDIRASMWHWWVDEQIGLVKRSNLHSHAKINMIVTMPRFAMDINGALLSSNSPPYLPMTFEEKFREYISYRHPFVNIISVRDTSEPNLYEGHALELIHQHCMQSDSYILYIHNKGMYSNSLTSVTWRELLNHVFIENWRDSIKSIDQYDIVGVKDAISANFVTSGNFWWSKSSYIRTLSSPIDSTTYIRHDPTCYPGGANYRYAFERWITSNNPAINFIFDTKTNHYREYFFLDSPKIE